MRAPMHVSRRQLLTQAAVVSGAVLLDGPAALARKKKHKAPAPKIPTAAGGAFSLGVASGYPDTQGAVLWTRLDGLARTSYVQLEVARDKDFRNVVKRAKVRANAVRDYTAHYRVGGLAAGEEYFYRFHTKHTSSMVGRLRTLRPADSKEPVRIGVFSCQSWEAGYYNAHAGLAAEPDLDLVLCLGDYVYEHHYYDGPAERKDTTGANRDGDVQTLDEYRAKYRLHKSDPNLQAVHALHPFVPIWDDHEVEDNYAGDAPDSASTSPDTLENDNKYPRRVPYAERKRAGYLAFNEYQPRLRGRPVDDVIYATIPLGANATVFITDQRQYRSAQPCKDMVVAPCAAASDAGQTMLGARQKAWFKDALSRDKATWKLWGSEVMLMGWDSAPGLPLSFDGWDGYQAERQEILEFVLAKGIKNLAALTGDIHTYVAGTLYTTGRVTTGKPAGTEFIGGAITSQGFDDLGDASSALLATNPHFKFFNGHRRGYMVVTAGGDELDVTFRSPPTVMDPTSKVETLAAFKVASGSTAVTQTT